MKLKTFSTEIKLSSKRDSAENIADAAKALSHPLRVKILDYLSSGPKTLAQLSKHFKVPQSGITFHVLLLEKGELVKVFVGSGTTTVSATVRHLSFVFENEPQIETSEEQMINSEIKIGDYIAIKPLAFNVVRGFDKDGKLIINEDNQWDVDRYKIEQLAIVSGTLVYPLPTVKDGTVTSLKIVFEACSEAPFYMIGYKSSISILVNGKWCGEYISPSDFGGRKGKLCPASWPDTNTQYGELIQLEIKGDGCMINGKAIKGSPKISDFNFSSNPTLEIGNLESGEYQGGLNLFGSRFGDYGQAIRITYGVCLDSNKK